MSGYIILRDIPKQEARLDLARYPIQGGFRGFQAVPAGVHYVSVLADGEPVGFWCHLTTGEALVRRFDETQGTFVEDDPATTAQYQQLATSGAMNAALQRADPQSAAAWQRLTTHIGPHPFPPALHEESPMQPPEGLEPDALAAWMGSQHKSRFEQALAGHGGQPEALLAEFQFAFARWLADQEDKSALARWRHLLQAIYNAGERGIEQAPTLFPPLIKTLQAQLDLLPDSYLAPGTFITQGAGYLAEDLIDVEIDGLTEVGHHWAAYLARRQGAG